MNSNKDYHLCERLGRQERLAGQQVGVGWGRSGRSQGSAEGKEPAVRGTPQVGGDSLCKGPEAE